MPIPERFLDELIARNSFYAGEETAAKEHICRITGGVRHG
mgnify:FL=1